MEFHRPIFPVPESDLARARFSSRYLSRPVFLEAHEFSGLERDLSLVWSALGTLPQRLYDGDLRAFARTVGMTEFQAACITRSEGPSPRALTRMARADLYKDAAGFRLLEWNLGSPVGGVECVDMCRALLTVPEMAAFVAEEGVVHTDTMEAMLATLRSETDHPEGTAPVVALVDTPGSFPRVEALIHHQAARWADFGLPSVIGHLGELTRSNGRLCLRGEPIDVVYRLFTIEDVLIHAGDGLLEPLLSAAECGEVVMFTPLSAELHGSKAALALLSEPTGQTGLSPEERDACDRLIPWTRRLHAGDAFAEDGSSVDLLAHVLERQDDLVLKPSLSSSGKGVVVGADPDVTPAVWRDQLAQAVNGSYVVQRLVRPVPELFPSATPGHLAPYTVAWGVFMMRRGYAGMVIRAIPADAEESIVSAAKGALNGCGFHAPAAGDGTNRPTAASAGPAAG